MEEQTVLMYVRGQPIYLNSDGTVEFIAGMTIDADGSPRAYAPKNSGLAPLDYLDNAGEPGNWYGILTDKDGTPIIQGSSDPYPGYYISTTAYQNTEFDREDPRRYLNSEEVIYAVIPGPLRNKIKPKFLGAKVEITNLRSGKVVEGIVGDIGPATHLGEASIKAAKELGISADVKTGGTPERIFRYIIHPIQVA